MCLLTFVFLWGLRGWIIITTLVDIQGYATLDKVDLLMGDHRLHTARREVSSSQGYAVTHVLMNYHGPRTKTVVKRPVEFDTPFRSNQSDRRHLMVCLV